MSDSTPPPKRRRWRWLRIALTVIPLLLCAAVVFHLWFYEYSAGEYSDSPDGRYTANLHRVYERTLRTGEIEYVRASVIDQKNGETVWLLEYKPANISSLYHYSDRSQRFIKWNATSDEVIFPLEHGGKQIVVPMP